jgi:hypothetical protein
LEKKVEKKKIGAIDIGFGNADSAGASKSLSVRTLCPDYYMPGFSDASGPNVYVVDSLEAMACELIDGYRHDLALIVRLARHTGDVNGRLAGLGRDLIACFNSKRVYLTEAELTTRWMAPFGL